MIFADQDDKIDPVRRRYTHATEIGQANSDCWRPASKGIEQPKTPLPILLGPRQAATFLSATGFLLP
jgi:hypothetical protein